MIRFTIFIEPIPKGRPRLNKYSKSIYTPNRTTDYEDILREEVIKQWGVDAEYPVFKKKIDYVRVDIDIVKKRIQRFQTKKYPDGLMWCNTGGDKDNYEKAVLDSLKGVLWEDDTIVVVGETRKLYTEKNGQPRVCLFITRAGDPPLGTIDNWTATNKDREERYCSDCKYKVFFHKHINDILKKENKENE